MIDTRQWIRVIESEPAPELWEEAERRANLGVTRQGPRQSRPLLAAVLMLVTLVVIGSVLFALRPLSSLRRSGAPGPGGITRYSMEGAPQPLAVGDGAAWVDVTHMSQRGTGPSLIYRIDAATGEIRQLPQTLGAVWVTAGAEGVWATCDTASCGGHGVLQLDPSTGDVVRTVSLPDHTSQIALGLGDVWVTTEGGLVKIDAASGQLVDTYPGRYNLLGVSENAVWVTTPGGVTQIDASTGRTLNHFPFPDACNLAVTPTVVYIATCGGATIKREALEAIDARTHRVLYRVTRDYSYGPMRVSGNTLIVAEHDPSAPGSIRLVQLDAATGKAAGLPFEIKSDETRFTIPSFIEPGPFFAVGEGSAWVSDFGAGEVLRVALPLTGSATPTSLPTQQTANPTGNGEPVAGGSGTLVLSDFQIDNPMDAAGQVNATYSIDWRGSGFPGFRQCTWTAYDQAGQEVGSKVDIVAALAPVAKQPVSFDVTSPASSMQATCSERLDIGTPYRYDFSNITVQGEADGYYVIDFDAKWAGTGQAGAVTCAITVVDASGRQVGSETNNVFIVEGGTRVGTEQVKATSSETTGLTASIDCVPFSG